MKILMARLMEIDTQCRPEREKKAQEEAEKQLDEFQLEKRHLANKIRDVRASLQERDDLLENGERARAAEKSAIVRRELKKIKEDSERLEKTYQSKHSKLKAKQKIPGVTIKAEKVAKDENRKKVVELTMQHLKELENREQNPGRASKLLAESVSDSSGEREVIAGGIPDIDDPQFELLRTQDAEIDRQLDITLEGVKRLKELALAAGEELSAQDDLIEEINEVAETALVKLETVNMELMKTLKAVRSARNLCCDLILIGVILGIATAVYFMFTK
jgi:hypothetical protein